MDLYVVLMLVLGKGRASPRVLDVGMGGDGGWSVVIPVS